MADPLEELLVDPETHERVLRATEAQLEAIRAQIADGTARRHDGGELPQTIDGAYLSRGGRWVYPDVDGFASFLIEERIELAEPVTLQA